jgi:hypothetical protein
MAFNRYRKGQSLYLGVPIFWAMQWRAHWIGELVPAMVRRLVPGPVAELRTQPQSEYVHASFFHDRARQMILVQILDAIALVTKGERRPTPAVEIALDPARFKISAAEIVWPQTKTVEVLFQAGRQSIRLENPDRYTALCLRIV